MNTAQLQALGYTCRRERYQAWGGDIWCYRVRDASGALVGPACTTPTTARRAWALARHTL